MKPKRDLKYRRFMLTESQIHRLRMALLKEVKRLQLGTAEDRDNARKLGDVSSSIWRQTKRQENPRVEQFVGFKDPETRQETY